MNRRILTLLAALVPVLVLGVIGTVVKVPFVALGPGPTFNTLGEVDGKAVVEVVGVEVDPTTGNLNMTTVAVRDGLNLFEAFGLWLSGQHGLVPRAEVYPPGVPREEIDRSNQQEFKDSEGQAEVAALKFLDLPTVVLVREVGDEAPAKDILMPGDELISVDGAPIATPADLVQAVSTRAPDTQLTLVVRREGQERTETVTLGARPDDPAKGYLGVTPGEGARPPMEVTFNLADIGGPSAGLMFSLALIDKLSPGELDGGKFVAGTGTIDGEGKVGPIGGIQYKMAAAREAGAETFLVPAANCNEARQRTPDGLRLVKVENLDGAVQALNAINTGAEAPSCG
ncbi:PDZ domain-containing protein [Nocardia puris]|uniref:endopeptidase La n=1 Tax=Nocardia puris TaxID=208602 RepID=A0A366DSC2_9NOCA|nr:PDZ domain-containing protein [Nocardia puris]MBF6216147.1 PDZ domain-containing protein [Nocardia puris]MBF6364706.1 PDZ domain-containing protein [Nocardia puris]MBF6463134.1 PDZ domain-containing protein [Nocardia puris]RBO92379.1 PDZ domain-containing protein [Nocardia puris]